MTTPEEKQEERDFLIECIKLYERLPALWNVKHKEYHNRDKKNYQYEVLLYKYRERYLGANKLDLRKKINILRTNFRKELKRINEAQQKGDVDVQTTLWYFEEMQFLTNQENESENNVKEEPTRIKSQASKNVIKNQASKNHPKKRKVKQETRTPSPQPIKRIKQEQKETGFFKSEPNEKDEASNDYISSTPKHFAPIENEYEKVAGFWSVELQKMNGRQQLFAKKAINDILFEGQLGNLHKNSVEINRISHSDAAVDLNLDNTYSPNIVYEDDESNNSRNFKFEIDHVDSIEHDTISNTESPQLNMVEEEVMDDMETTNDGSNDILQLLENPVLEENGEEQDKNKLDVDKIIYTSLDAEEEQTNYKNKTKDRRVMCSYCSKIIHNITYLKIHEETHKEHRERKWICSHCGIKLLSKSALYSHLQTHNENREKKVQCEFCDKSYYRGSALNIHKRIHLGQMLKCPMCPKEYYRTVDLNRHMSTHSAAPIHNVVNKYKYIINCKDCGKKVPTNRWKSHIAVHMNNPLAKCSICNKDFFSRRSCSRHVRFVHNIVRENYDNVIIQYENKSKRQSLLMLKQQEIVEALD